MRLLLLAFAVIALSVSAVLFRFGTVSPCGILRGQVQHEIQIESIDVLLSSMSDSTIDQTMAQRFGQLSPARCASLLFNRYRQQPLGVASQMPADLLPGAIALASSIHIHVDALNTANAAAVAATNECDRRRRVGGLSSNSDVARCAEPHIISAYATAGFPYMDLVRSAVAKRIEIAEELDSRALTEDQAQSKIAQLISVFNDKMRERQRIAQ